MIGLLTGIPLPYKLIAVAALAATLSFCSYKKGVEHTTNAFAAQELDYAKKEAEKKVDSEAVTQETVTVYVDRIITQKEIQVKYVPKIVREIDPNTSCPPEFIGLYNEQIIESERNAGTPIEPNDGA